MTFRSITLPLEKMAEAPTIKAVTVEVCNGVKENIGMQQKCGDKG